MEILVLLIKIVEGLEGLHRLKSLIEAARSNPQITAALSALALAGAIVAVIIRRTRRHEVTSIR